MDREKLSNAIGLCKKAGKCVGGDFAAEKTVRAGKAALVILDAACSENTKDKYTYLCRGRSVPLIFAEEPGRCMGQPEKMVLAITDAGFAKMIQNAYTL